MKDQVESDGSTILRVSNGENGGSRETGRETYRGHLFMDILKVYRNKNVQ